jgi:phosphoribosylglycinamide formyltransferase 1
MARYAVMASGSGTNFEAIVRALSGSGHEAALLLCDRKAAAVFGRAERLGVPSRYLPYLGRTREEAEAEALKAIRDSGAELIFLAGFMRVLGPLFVGALEGRLVNIHPSLLPAYPGAHAIQRCYEAGDSRFGITIHYVDQGMDTGPRIVQRSLERLPAETLAGFEARVHGLEHLWYPAIARALLDEVELGRRNPS